MTTEGDLAVQDWLAAEREYLAQRPIDGSIPAKQIWRLDTIAGRAYAKFISRRDSP